MNWKNRILNWRKVRTLGELKIITKASYFMLVFIPVLAGIWPIVNLGLNSYHEKIKDSAQNLESSIIKLEYHTKEIATNDTLNTKQIAESSKIIEKINSQLKSSSDGLDEIKPKMTYLPSIWVYAFLAALAIFFAQLLYQANAPEIIKNNRIDEYKIKKKNEYTDNPTESAIRKSIDFMERIKNEIDLKIDTSEIGPFGDINQNRKRENDIIENGAFAEYFYWSKTKIVYAWISGILYYIGIAIILIIILNQTMSVLNAAGWIN